MCLVYRYLIHRVLVLLDYVYNVIRCRDLQGKHSVSTIFALMIAGTLWICQATGINPTLETCYVFLI